MQNNVLLYISEVGSGDRKGVQPNYQPTVPSPPNSDTNGNYATRCM